MQELYLLDTRFHKLTQDQLLSCIVEQASVKEKTVIANVNVHAMNLAYELDWYRDFLNQAHVVFCDGFGVALGARLTGQKIEMEHRLTCPDWIEKLALVCEQNKLSLFLLAGEVGIVEEATRKLKTVAPGLKVAGHHGYFQKVGSENDQVIAQINAFEPHILYIGFGMPLQEEWIQHNINRVEARVFLPLGACLDFYTGKVYRGPHWLTDYGLEWLSRLLTEPKRLWRRYIIGNTLFLWRVLRQRLRYR